MYLVISHIPLYVDGRSSFVTTEWKRSLLLLRDSLQGRLGEVTLLAPSIPLAEAHPEQLLEKLDEIATLPALDLRGRARHFWLHQYRPWRAFLSHHVQQATMVHAGMDQLWKPIQYTGFLEGVKQHKPTLFVMDTDIVTQVRQLSQHLPWPSALKNRLYTLFLDRSIRRSVRKASLALLKGRALFDRYAPYTSNPHLFHDTSYLSSDVIPESVLEERLQGFLKRSTLSLVYCGRLEERKGVLESLHLLRACKDRGLQIHFDIIGDGPQRQKLDQAASELSLQEVRFLGARPYGPALLKTLASYDALLFTPLAEDTPRMIFDGFAEGLPLLGTAIPYSKEILSSAGILWENRQQGVAILERLCKERNLLLALARNARTAGKKDAADVWYQKRAEWTFQSACV